MAEEKESVSLTVKLEGDALKLVLEDQAKYEAEKPPRTVGKNIIINKRLCELYKLIKKPI